MPWGMRTVYCLAQLYDCPVLKLNFAHSSLADTATVKWLASAMAAGSLQSGIRMFVG